MLGLPPGVAWPVARDVVEGKAPRGTYEYAEGAPGMKPGPDPFDGCLGDCSGPWNRFVDSASEKEESDG